MFDPSEQILVDALVANVAHVTAATLRHPDPPAALHGQTEPAALELTVPGQRTALNQRPVASRHWSAWAGAAVVAAALTLGAVTVAHSGGRSHDDNVGARGYTPTLTSVPFAVAPSAGYTVTGASASVAGPDYLLLAGHNDTFSVDTFPPGEHDVTSTGTPVITTGSLAVQVNGHPGYFGCLDGTAYRDCPTPELAWRYEPDAWADVSPALSAATGASNETVAGLLRVARSIDFSRHTSVTFPLRIATAPPGATLMSWHFRYPPKSITKDSSFISVTYRYPTGEFIEVILLHGPASEGRYRHTAVSTGRRHGYWAAAGPDLDLNVGHNLNVDINESSSLGLKTKLSLHDALAFAAGISVSPQPENQATWYPIDSALAHG